MPHVHSGRSRDISCNKLVQIVFTWMLGMIRYDQAQIVVHLTTWLSDQNSYENVTLSSGALNSAVSPSSVRPTTTQLPVNRHYVFCLFMCSCQCSAQLRSEKLRTQKLKSHLVRTQSLNVLPFKPGVGQYIAINAMLTAREFFLAYFFPSSPFTCIFSKTSSNFFLCWPAE